MTEETLRKWANGELTPSEERDVYRWMVTCTSPELPGLLHGLLRERREREADQALSGRGSLWTTLVEAWNTLLDAGHAEWTDPSGDLVLASADEAEARPWARLVEQEDGTALVFEPGADDVAAYLTTDAPTLERLVAPGPPPASPVPAPKPGARPTVWVFKGQGLATASDPSAELTAHLGRDDLESLALRWTD